MAISKRADRPSNSRHISRPEGWCAAADTGHDALSFHPTVKKCTCRSARARMCRITLRKKVARVSSSLILTGTGQKVYAWGIRKAVGIAFRPGTNELWMSTNERDEIGEDLPPDYISSVRPGGFYGWPWYYIGNHQDPRHKGKHPELADKVIVPDVLVQAHSASLNLCFYTGDQFPSEYQGDIFA